MSKDTTPKSKFKNAMGFRYLRGLFYETRVLDETPLYSLKDYDLKKDDLSYPSLYKLYMACGDPTEYSFAVKYLDNWQHWMELTQCTWFQETVEAWRLELETKLRSEGLAKIMAASKGTTRDAFQASRYLVERGWVAKSSKGRPSKDTIRKEAVRIASEEQRLTEDAIRILPN